MGALIDASVLIAYERGRLNLEESLAGHEEEELLISVITASELLHGARRARDAKVRARRSAFERFPLLKIDLAIARFYAQLWADP